MLVIEVCERFGWDYHTYMSQPAWFLDLITSKLEIDAKKQEAEHRRITK